MSGYQFVNPYNFIPLSKNERGKKEASAQEKADYTGVIHYSVLTKTPLFIPNTSSDRAFDVGTEEHKSYDFFSYTNLSECKTEPKEPTAMPVIPGSEMRGMLRSNFEILTNSCMSSFDADVTLSKRTQERFLPGLIRRNESGGYDLYPAEDHLMRTMGANSLRDDWKDDQEHWVRQCYIQEKLKEGVRVYFKQKRRSRGKSLATCVKLTKEKEHNAEGYIIKGEAGIESGRKQQKHCCHVFVLKKTEKEIRKNISPDTLQKALDEYEKNKDHLYTEYAESLEAFKKGNGELYFPVYYSEAVEGHLMLSPACITREIYKTKLSDLVGKEHRTCTDLNNLCPACTLFGTVVEKATSDSKESFAHTSRLRVSDLTCIPDRAEIKDYYSRKPITLKPLSGPKLNNMEFYLQRPKGAGFWTYDYYIDVDGKIYPYDGTINGRKFYWHQMDLTCAKLEREMEEAERRPETEKERLDTRVRKAQDQLNVTVRPVRENVSFSGEIYFQNLTKTELNQMIYLLNAGDEEKNISLKKHGYKLGGAKPLGFGSIAVSVDGIELRRFEKNEKSGRIERKVFPYQMEAGESLEFDGKIVQDFRKMTAFDAVKGVAIHYPYVPGKESIYDWFTQNHVRYKDRKVSHGMPAGRREMAYAEYMEAMKPELAAVWKDIKEHGEADKAAEETAVVKRTAKTGNVLIEVNGTEGTIYANMLGERTILPGETVKVKFMREKTYPDGNKMKFYKLI